MTDVLIVPIPKNLRLLVPGNARLDTLKANFKKVIDCELDRMHPPLMGQWVTGSGGNKPSQPILP